MIMRMYIHKCARMYARTGVNMHTYTRAHVYVSVCGRNSSAYGSPTNIIELLRTIGERFQNSPPF